VRPVRQDPLFPEDPTAGARDGLAWKLALIKGPGKRIGASETWTFHHLIRGFCCVAARTISQATDYAKPPPCGKVDQYAS
jgi:hypothetical protein